MKPHEMTERVVAQFANQAEQASPDDLLVQGRLLPLLIDAMAADPTISLPKATARLDAARASEADTPVNPLEMLLYIAAIQRELADAEVTITVLQNLISQDFAGLTEFDRLCLSTFLADLVFQVLHDPKNYFLDIPQLVEQLMQRTPFQQAALRMPFLDAAKVREYIKLAKTKYLEILLERMDDNLQDRES